MIKFVLARLYLAIIAAYLFLVAGLGGEEKLLFLAFVAFFPALLPRWLPFFGAMPNPILYTYLFLAVAIFLALLMAAFSYENFFDPESLVISVGMPISLIAIVVELFGLIKKNRTAGSADAAS